MHRDDSPPGYETVVEFRNTSNLSSLVTVQDVEVRPFYDYCDCYNGWLCRTSLVNTYYRLIVILHHCYMKTPPSSPCQVPTTRLFNSLMMPHHHYHLPVNLRMVRFKMDLLQWPLQKNHMTLYICCCVYVLNLHVHDVNIQDSLTVNIVHVFYY